MFSVTRNNPMIEETDFEISSRNGGHSTSARCRDILERKECSTFTAGSDFIGTTTISLASGKILQYNTRPKSRLFWGLVTISHTILAKYDIWLHLCVFAIVAFISFRIIRASDTASSIEVFHVGDTISMLLSFILGGYVNRCVARWDRIRTDGIGLLLDHFDQANMIAGSWFQGSDPQEVRLRERVLQYCRMALATVFLHAQNDPDLTPLVRSGALNASDPEYECLSAATVDSRPYLVVGWLHALFESAHSAGYSRLNRDDYWSITRSIRSRVHVLLDDVHTPLPLPYVHLIYWGVQLLLCCIAAEVGVNVAVTMARKENGNGDYDDDKGEWPEHPKSYFGHNVVAMIVTKGIFFFFMEGLLFVCEAIQNPLSKKPVSIAEDALDAELFNKAKCLHAGLVSFHTLHPPLLSKSE